MESTSPTQVGSERHSVSNSRSEIVLFPLASIANTSNLYSVPGSMNSDGTVTLVVAGETSALNTTRGVSFSRSTMTW